jgi:hypothetical protein
MNKRQLIQQEKNDFDNKEIQIVEGFTFNQKKTIERIYRYYNSKFEEGDVDRDGDKKYFFNISRNPCKVTTKAIDFDPKDIRILTAAGGSPLTTWFFERDLKYRMKDQNFGRVLNRIFEELPIFGSVVIKLVDGKPEFVDLRNLIVEQSADTLGQANYIIEKHIYTPTELRKIGKKLNWNNLEATLKEHYKTQSPYIYVYERYGDVIDTDAKGNQTRAYKRLVLADVGKDERDSYGNVASVAPGVVLEETEVETHPYNEFHLEKVPGRWLGVGVVEILFDAQVKQNEIANLMSKASYWAALHLFQTPDETVNRNLRTDVRDGEVLNPDQPVTQVEISERNLAFFAQETQKWMRNADDLTFRYEVVSGERLPAGTPLGSAKISLMMNAAYFDQIRENVALAVKEFLYNVVIPQFKKENGGEHILRLTGIDLDKINNLIIDQAATDELFSYMARENKLPSREYLETVKSAIGERVKQHKERLLRIPGDFYKNLKYKLDIVITGQYRDTAVESQALLALIQASTTDPMMAQVIDRKKLVNAWLESGGINPIDFEPEKPMPSMAEMMMGIPVKGAGGGVSKPLPMPSMMSSMPATAEQTL